jgi:hypothetical protein
MAGMRRGRFVARSGAGGMNARGAGGCSGGGAICSGNSDGFGGIGRIVTSSIIGSTAAATAAWAAASIEAWDCCATAAAMPPAHAPACAARFARGEPRLLLLGPQLIGAKLLGELRDPGLGCVRRPLQGGLDRYRSPPPRRG